MRALTNGNIQLLVDTLAAELDATSDGETYTFRFSDPIARYELHLTPAAGTAQLAIDPIDPIQACPLLEFGFRYQRIEFGQSAYGPEPAVRFYDGDCPRNDVRLMLTRRPDARWYVFANANPIPYPERRG